MARQNKNDLSNVGDVKLDLLKGYGKLSPWNVEIEAGRDSLWFGQGYHGTLLMTNNAFPLNLVKISNPNPTLLPWIFQYLGPFKYTVFVSWMEEHRDHPHCNLGGLRLNFKPLANQRVRDETFAEVTNAFRSPRIRFHGFPPSATMSTVAGLAELK